MGLNSALGKLLGNDKKFDEILIDRRVVDEIIKIAVNSDPKEFMALLSGKIEDLKLKITGFIFLPFEASDTSAVMEIFMMPLKNDSVGSVHSHPGPSAEPSNTDLLFFERNGIFHMIICRPYNEYTIRAYDAFGTPVPYTITDLGNEVEIQAWDNLNVNDQFFDDELLAELKELEDEEDNLAELEAENDVDHLDDDLLNMLEDDGVPEQPEIPTITMQIENNGKIIEKTIPLPESFKEGDDLVIDIRTDQPPEESMEELTLDTKTFTNPDVSDKLRAKSSEEIEREISIMESDIEEIKKENKRLLEESKKKANN